MLLHLLNEKGPTGRPIAAWIVPGCPKFTRVDVELELFKLTTPKWWEFWKR